MPNISEVVPKEQVRKLLSDASWAAGFSIVAFAVSLITIITSPHDKLALITGCSLLLTSAVYGGKAVSHFGKALIAQMTTPASHSANEFPLIKNSGEKVPSPRL